MSSYGHHPAPDRGAHDGGYDGHDSYREYRDTYAVDSYGADPYGADPYPADPYAGGAARATATVGAASPGRASVAAPTGSPRPRYDWSGGRRGGGPAAAGTAAAGRASVPVSPATGAASGRATVRPGGSGGPGPPGGPGGPAGTGPRGGAGRPARKKKRHWLRNSLLIALAVIVISTGGGMVALSYYVDSVPPPELVDLAEGSTVRYANGDEMAVLEKINREIIDTTVPELANVRNAVIAAEDQDFYAHSGVDFAGIVRAAWNNVTGGARQGASTIDQQYTREAAGLSEDSYRRKLKEAAMAYKLNQEHSKDEILDFYLNTIYFGRGAYGVQAAAQAYFGKPAAKLSVAEAAVIAGTIRIPDDGSGLSPYDPRHTPDNPQVALNRWNYVLSQMVEMGKLDPAERAELTELPETVKPKDTKSWHKGPQGPIVNQVQRELEQMGITDVETGGYRITTTIDQKLQRLALDAVRRKNNKASHWQGMPENVHAAMTAIDPATGAVLAYYGGENGAGIDLAGKNYNEKAEKWQGGWPPGSTFKIYTLVAELREGISFDSHWQTSPYDADWAEQQIHNAGRTATTCEGTAPDYCTLRWSTQRSFNVPFAHFSEAVPRHEGPARILDAAMDAGITMMTDNQGVAHDLTEIENASAVAPSHFDHPVAYGQYGITVLDHASGVATIAASGVYHEPHFVRSVEQKVNGEWELVAGSRVNGEQRIEPQYADAITGVLSTIPDIWGFPLAGGRPAAAKTGTWEHVDENGYVDGNADAWVVGYTPQIATAVWVGDPKRGKIVDQTGGDIGSSGLPADIWQQFMNDAHAAKDYQFAQFPPAPPVGDPQHPLANGVPPQPEEPDRDDDCRVPFFGCDDDGGEDDRDNDNGGGNDGDNGGGDDSDDQTGGTVRPGPGLPSPPAPGGDEGA